MDRHYAEPLDVAAIARVAHVSPAHFSRRFKMAFGETPHRYLQRRRIERSMAQQAALRHRLRTPRPVRQPHPRHPARRGAGRGNRRGHRPLVRGVSRSLAEGIFFP
ncbi:AraC family transcriptional regulator [Nocardioides sp. NPDC058538]|uniref:AraC family transcriptional regulator n=1 Tax=Nocardioides sp. NPDC058538 TaxID=3346542 RepID=UPI0036600B72